MISNYDYELASNFFIDVQEKINCEYGVYPRDISGIDLGIFIKFLYPECDSDDISSMAVDMMDDFGGDYKLNTDLLSVFILHLISNKSILDKIIDEFSEILSISYIGNILTILYRGDLIPHIYKESGDNLEEGILKSLDDSKNELVFIFKCIDINTFISIKKIIVESEVYNSGSNTVLLAL